MLDPLLQRYAIKDRVTRANLYFAIPHMGATPIDGITDTDPEKALTCVTVKYAEAVAQRIHKAGLTCKVLQSRDFARSAAEKLIWICVFNLIGAVHGGITVGEVEAKHWREIDYLSLELAQMIRFNLRVSLFEGLEDRICAYARAVKDFPTALKEFQSRNGYFYQISQKAMEVGFPDQTPMHTEYLESGKSTLGR